MSIFRLIGSCSFLVIPSYSVQMYLTWVDCTEKADGATVDSVDFGSEMITMGKPLHVNTTITIKDSETVEDGSYYVMRSKFDTIGMTLMNKKGALCEKTVIDMPLGVGKITKNGIECPAKTGQQIKMTSVVDLPWFTPPGTFVNSVTVYNQNKKKLFCVATTMSTHKK